MNWEDVARKLAYEIGVKSLENAAIKSELEATQRLLNELQVEESKEESE